MHKDKNRFFNAVTANGTLTLDMYDFIGGDMFGDGITEGMVANALASSTSNAVTLNINSPGGDAFAGVAIRNVLSQSGRKVTVNVVGLAASAASIVAMAGDNIVMHSGSVMMIHPAQAMTMGSADDMRKMADTLDTVTNSIADIYVAKTGLDKSKVLDMMSAETWMSGEEAVANGFATAVSKEQKAVTNSYDLSILAFKNTPVELQAVVKTREVDGEHLTAGDFIYVGNPDDPSTWALPYKFATDEKTKSHLRDALARFDEDEVIPAAHKAEAWAKLVRICGEYGIDVSRKGNPKNETEPILIDTSDHANRINIMLKQLEINRRR